MRLTPEALDDLLIEDAELVKELSAAGGSWQPAGEWLLEVGRGRIAALKNAIAQAKTDAASRRRWAARARFESEAAAEALKHPILLRPKSVPDVTGKDTGGAFAGRGEPERNLGRGSY